MKAPVSNIKVPLGFVVVPKALAMARWSAVASSFVILPSLPLPVPSTCTVQLLSSPWLAPYCSSLASPILLPVDWRPTATRWLASYCSSSSAGIPSAQWLRSPTSLSPPCDLLYGRKPRLGYHESWYRTTSLAYSKRRPIDILQSLLTVNWPAPNCDLSWGILARHFGKSSLSRNFLDSFPSVTRGPAEGFGSLSCTSLPFVPLRV